MSLEALLDAINASGDLQVREIRAQADARSEAVLTAAREEAAQIQAAAFQSALAPAAGECSRRLHQARLEALQTVGGVVERLLNAAFEQAHQRLIAMRGAPIYPQVLRGLVLEALADLEGTYDAQNPPLLSADPRDRALLEGILAELGMPYPVSYDLTCSGGVAVFTSDGRIAAINTLDLRFERALPLLRARLSAFFEDSSLIEDQTVQAIRADGN